MNDENALAYFYLLQEQQDEIEQDFGQPLLWEPKHSLKHSNIGLENTELNPNDRSQWPAQHKWIADQLETFNRVFRDRVRNLDAEDYIPEDGEDYESEPL